MAHKKAAGGGERQHKNPTGKRLGVKKAHGSKVVSGNIILRQKGTIVKSGLGTGIGKDFTVFAVKEGVVNFRHVPGKAGKKMVEVK